MKTTSKNNSRINLLLPLILILYFLSPGCSSDEPVKIGFVGGTSGRVADLGLSGRDAVQLVIDQVNNNEGIHGRQVKLIFKDDQQNPERAKNVVQELLNEGIQAIIGPMTSDMAMAITPLLNKAEVVAVSPTATTQKLSGQDDYFFRVSATTKEYAGKSARYHAKSTKVRRLVATYDLNNRSFCENWLENFKTDFTITGGKVIESIGFDTNIKESMLDLAKKLLQSKADGILIIANSMDSALICQQIRKLDKDIYLTLADWGATERLLELGGKAVEGVTVIQTFDRDSNVPQYQKFRKDFLGKYNREPGFPGVYSYDAATVVIKALAKQQRGTSLKKTILKLKTFDGLQGSFSFDNYGDVIRTNASISIVRNGKFVVLE